MADRLKFIGWGNENTGFDETERTRLFRFVADRLGIEPRLIAAPRIEEISLPPPRVVRGKRPHRRGNAQPLTCARAV